MRRRTGWTTAALAVLLVLPAGPATAASSTLVEPEGDVTGPTPIRVQFERDFNAEIVREVQAALRRDGQRLGERVQLQCEEGCEDPTAERVVFVLPGGASFRPGTGAPFGAEGPLPNGGYTLRVDLIKDSRFQDDESFEHELHLAVPPSAPQGLEAIVEDAEVALSWAPSSQPDVDTYRVERHDGEDWEELTSTSESSAVDEPGTGEHRYRVVAQRPDGREGTLEAASEEVTVEVEAAADADDGGDGGDDAEGDDGSDDSEGSDDEDEDGEDERGEDDDAPSSGSSSDGGSGGTARAPRTDDDGPSGQVPGLSDGGEDQEPPDDFEEELDYGELEAERPDEVQVASPGGWRGTVDRIFDAEQVAVPIATGLVMTATGLHLWRWLRVPV